MAIRMKILNRLRMLKEPIAAEVIASDQSRRAWVSIRPYQDSAPSEPLDPETPWTYQVIRFEVEKKYLEDEAYEEAVFYDELGVHNKQIIEVSSEEEALQVITRWLDDLEKLDAPWHCEYPI
jgi:hypothetical protein